MPRDLTQRIVPRPEIAPILAQIKKYRSNHKVVAIISDPRPHRVIAVGNINAGRAWAHLQGNRCADGR